MHGYNGRNFAGKNIRHEIILIANSKELTGLIF